MLPDVLPEGAGTFRCAGLVVFSSGSGCYSSREEFEADASRHGGAPGSPLHAKYAGDGEG